MASSSGVFCSREVAAADQPSGEGGERRRAFKVGRWPTESGGWWVVFGKVPWF